MVPENLHPMVSSVGHEVPEGGNVVHASAAGEVTPMSHQEQKML